jgi:hypothetical protein
MLQLKYMQLLDVIYVQNGCETAIIQDCLTVKHML